MPVNPHSSNLRKGRYSQRGQHYFLTTSIARRRPIFTVHEHAMIVLDALRWLHAADRFIVHAAVVMPDHLHLAGQLAEHTLPSVMHTLKSYTARCLTAKDVESPVWQSGYHDHALRDDEDYAARVRYLIENPVRAGLVGRAEEYSYVILPGWWVAGGIQPVGVASSRDIDR